MKEAHDDDVDVTTQAMGDDADTPIAPAIDRRMKEQLLILMLLDSLRCDDDAKGNDDDQKEETVKGSRSISLNDMQVDVSKQIMTIAQRMFDNHMPDLCHRDEDVKPSSSDHLVPSEQQLMSVKGAAEGDATTAVVKKRRASAKKKRNRKNKAAAKRRKKTRCMSWLRGTEILLRIAIMAFGSIATLIVTFAIIHQSVDGSSEGGGATPALPPTASKSLLRRNALNPPNQHQPASTSASVSVVVTTPSKPPDAIDSPSVRATSQIVSEVSPTPTLSSSPTKSCLDTPNWKGKWGYECDMFERWDHEPGCPTLGDWYVGYMGKATEHCCHCGGGIRTVSLMVFSFSL